MQTAADLKLGLARVRVLGADQKKSGLWGRDCVRQISVKSGKKSVSAELKSEVSVECDFFRICEPTLSWYFIMRISASCRDIVSSS